MSENNGTQREAYQQTAVYDVTDHSKQTAIPVAKPTQFNEIQSSTEYDSTTSLKLFTPDKDVYQDDDQNIEDNSQIKVIIIGCGVAVGPLMCFLYIAIRACVESNRKVHPQATGTERKPKDGRQMKVSRKKTVLSVNLMDKYDVSSTSTSYTTISSVLPTWGMSLMTPCVYCWMKRLRIVFF